MGARKKGRRRGRVESRGEGGRGEEDESRPVGDPIRAAGFFQRRES